MSTPTSLAGAWREPQYFQNCSRVWTASLPNSCRPLSFVTLAEKTEKASLYFVPLQQQNMEDIWNLIGFPDQIVFRISSYTFFEFVSERLFS